MGCTFVITFAASTLPPMRMRVAFDFASASNACAAAADFAEPSACTSTVSLVLPMFNLAVIARSNIGSTNETVDVQAEGSAKSAAAAQALEAEAKSKATRIRIGGNVEAAKVITKVQPI